MPRIGTQVVFGLFLLVIAGCGRPAPTNYTKWSSQDSSSQVNDHDASQKLMSAGMTVEQQARLSVKIDSKGRPSAPLTTRTNFFPKQKAEARKIIGNSRATALNAALSLKSLNYVPTGLAQPPAYLSGLRLIGSSIIWDIEEAIHNHDYDNAIVACGSATLLGNSLMSGGAYESSLGAAMINQARQKMVPILGALSAVQLGKLGSAVQKASVNRPPITVAIGNERENMLAGLQQAQDFFEAKKFSQLQERIGSSAKDTVDMLKSMQNDPERARALFDWIGNDIKARTEWHLKLVQNPRTVGLGPKVDEKKANLMLYRYFGSSVENLVPLLKMTYCRTQLFILECFLKQKMKMQRPLPTNLSAFSKSATIDPFTGDPFYYKAGSMTYVLYSAGEDGVDNLGDTDSSFRRPDVLLEKPHN